MIATGSMGNPADCSDRMGSIIMEVCVTATVEVYLDAGQSAEPDSMGMLHRQRSGKGELFSFKADSR